MIGHRYPEMYEEEKSTSKLEAHLAIFMVAKYIANTEAASIT